MFSLSLSKTLAGLLLAASAAASAAAPSYLRSSSYLPWRVTTNETAMNRVFGAGNWADMRYETVDASALFSAATPFIFLEGGDYGADEFGAFLAANSALLHDWVDGGGRLFVNAAPNEGGDIDLGFGVTLNYPDFYGGEVAVAANPAHPIFSGPFSPVATEYRGSFFSHASVSGAGLGAILFDGSAELVLAEMAVGSGLGMFGGMTTDNFHSPATQAANLRANIIAYTAGVVPVVPEPGTFVLFGVGLAGLAALRRRGGVAPTLST